MHRCKGRISQEQARALALEPIPFTPPALAPNCIDSQEAEALLCAQRGLASWQAYLEQAKAGGAGAPCTYVWTAGTIAYR